MYRNVNTVTIMYPLSVYDLTDRVAADMDVMVSLSVSVSVMVVLLLLLLLLLWLA